MPLSTGPAHSEQEADRPFRQCNGDRGCISGDLPVLIFDLDGTLTHSKPGIIGCLKRTLESYQLNVPGPLDRFVGPPVEDWALELLPEASESDRAAFARYYRACYSDTGWKDNSLFPGVREALTELSRRGFPLYVCTSKQQHFAIRILEAFQLDRLFAAIFGDKAEYEDHSKGQLLHALLRAHSLAGKEVWMIGDRIHDFQAARENSIQSLAVTWGYGEDSEYGLADAVIEKPQDLLTFFPVRDAKA